MKLRKEERLQVGKKIYEKELSIEDVMKEYGISRSCAEGWQTQYKRSAGILEKKRRSLLIMKVFQKTSSFWRS